MEAASDSDMMGVMQTAMGGSPTNLLEAAGWENPKSVIFAQKAVEYHGRVLNGSPENKRVHKSTWLGCDLRIHQGRRAQVD